MKAREKLRWRCRRGMLELDIVLVRFVETRYGALDAAGREAFEALLEVSDTALWDMIAGKGEPVPEAWRGVLEELRSA